MFKKCKSCDHAGKDCVPYLVSLSSANLIEWCRERKQFLHISNAQISEGTNVPKGTIDRLFSPGNTDFRYSTMQPIVFFLAGIKPEELNCEALHEAEERNGETVELLKDQVKHEQELAHTRMHIIQILAIALAVSAFVIILALVTDFIDPNLGYLWYTPHN